MSFPRTNPLPRPAEASNAGSEATGGVRDGIRWERSELLSVRLFVWAMTKFDVNFLVDNLVPGHPLMRKKPGLDPVLISGTRLCCLTHFSDWRLALFFPFSNGFLQIYLSFPSELKEKKKWTKTGARPRKHLPHRRGLCFANPILQWLFCNLFHTSADLRGPRNPQENAGGVTEYVGHLSRKQL